jgi:predicted SnoaL-like aldol condensation-catalyzing enzyme
MSQSVTEQNRKIVEAFADIFYRQKDVERAFLEFVSEDYIQHNPNILDGRQSAIDMLKPKFSSPEASFDIKRILVDGDLALIHLHGRMNQHTPGGAVADIFRLENGKIVEHWDVLQAVPENAVNPHPMF